MILIETGRPAAEPVSVAEAKAWARIERADEDALIGRLIGAARETAERETALVLARRAFRAAIDAVPADGRIALGRGPVRAVTAVRFFEADGTERTAAPATVRIAGDGLVLGEALRGATGVEVEFEAGLDPGAVPDGVRQAMLRIVAASYEARGIVEEAMQPAIVPAFAKALLAPYRRVRL